MTNTTARPMTAAEYNQGYAVCGCEKYAYVFHGAVLRTLPDGYSGELCAECSMLMVAVDKLPALAKDKP